MHRSDYLRVLREQLEGRLSDEEIDDILTDYESFFVSGREEGLTERQIADRLGAPALVAHSLLEEQRSSSEPERSAAAPVRRLLAMAIDAAIAVMPTAVLSVLIGTALLPYLMILAYPSPALGALTNIGFSTYTESSVVERNEHGEVVREHRTSQDGRQPTAFTVTLAAFGLLFYVTYALVCTLVWNGQTVGKKLLRIRVQHAERSGRAGADRLLARELLGKLLLNAIPLVPLVSLFTVLLTREHKAVHDLIAGTVVTDV